MNKQELQKIENRWLQAGSTRERFEREASFALQTYNNNGLLQKCTKDSLLSAVYNVALTGLSLNPVLKHAALVPRWNSKEQQYEACLEPQYQGLIYLAIKSGTVKAIQANIIYEGDEVEIDYAELRKVTRHIPYLLTLKPKGEIRAVYSIALLESGERLGELMTWPEIEDIMKRSESYKAYQAQKIKSCIWVTDLGEMAKKTVIKRHIKTLSKGENTGLMQAVELDNEIHGFRPLADINQIEYLTHLIEDELVIDDDTLDRLRVKLSRLTFRDEAQALVQEIFDNYIQPDQNLTQTKINRIVDKKIADPNS